MIVRGILIALMLSLVCFWFPLGAILYIIYCGS